MAYPTSSPSKSRKPGSLPVGSGRFHPANFQSTPSNPLSSTTSASTAAAQRQYADAQRRLYAYQREMLAASTPRSIKAAGSIPASGSQRPSRPNSPRLAPLGSPGPVTPLELEQASDYFVGGGSQQKHKHKQSFGEAPQQDLMDILLRDEAQRRRESQSGRPSTSGRSSTRC